MVLLTRRSRRRTNVLLNIMKYSLFLSRLSLCICNNTLLLMLSIPVQCIRFYLFTVDVYIISRCTRVLTYLPGWIPNYLCTVSVNLSYPSSVIHPSTMKQNFLAFIFSSHFHSVRRRTTIRKLWGGSEPSVLLSTRFWTISIVFKRLCCLFISSWFSIANSATEWTHFIMFVLSDQSIVNFALVGFLAMCTPHVSCLNSRVRTSLIRRWHWKKS